MFGTWHPTSLDRSLTDRSPAASVSRTHSRFGSASARPTAANFCLSVSPEIPTCSTAQMISRLAQIRKYDLGPGAPGSVEPVGLESFVLDSGVVRQLVKHRSTNLLR